MAALKDTNSSSPAQLDCLEQRLEGQEAKLPHLVSSGVELSSMRSSGDPAIATPDREHVLAHQLSQTDSSYWNPLGPRQADFHL